MSQGVSRTDLEERVTQNSGVTGEPVLRMYHDTADAAHGVPSSAKFVCCLPSPKNVCNSGEDGQERS